MAAIILSSDVILLLPLCAFRLLKRLSTDIRTGHVALSASLLLYSPFLIALFPLAYRAGGGSARISEWGECD